ncbi:DNA cytosine methyltransferase, partial [Burkholderia sp. SIMBA_042]|uniref:DNA cytosine methyltransferase n=1 Tax=Burkholderia sp. SIMBA_042 TaxID=3085783 RepID=UPI00397B30E1
MLNSASMGVPQKRERIFFIAHRNDQSLPRLKLEFHERPILYKEIRFGRGRALDPKTLTYKRWLERRPRDDSFGDITERIAG